MYVVLTDAKDGLAMRWSADYVKSQPQARKNVSMARSLTPAAVVAKIKEAVELAGKDGTLIFNVGHGSSDSSQLHDPKVGMVDLAPSRSLRLGGHGQTNVFVDVFYDVNLSLPFGHSDLDNDLLYNQGTAGATLRKSHWQTYLAISALFKKVQPRNVIFLTCNVGKSADFLKKIANDWGVIIQGYMDRMVLDPQPSGRTRMHLQGDSPGFFTNIPASEEEVPIAGPNKSIQVGPPLHP
jgi:hypothetical protein